MGDRRAHVWVERLSAAAGYDSTSRWGVEFAGTLTDVLELLFTTGAAVASMPEIARICARRAWSQQHAVTGGEDASMAEQRALIIVGMPRSGTSLLQNLLAYSTNAVTPRAMDLVGVGDTSARIRTAYARANVAEQRSPGLTGIHRLPVRGPDECSTGMLNHMSGLQPSVLWSARLVSLIDDEHASGAFRRHLRDLVQVNPSTAGLPWLLKSPDHVFRLGTLRGTLPRARFVTVTRPLVEVRASWEQLVRSSRRAAGGEVRPDELRIFGDLWRRAHDLIVADSHDDLMTVDHSALVGGPYRTCQQVAAFGGLDVDARRLARACQLLVRRRSGRKSQVGPNAPPSSTVV